MHKRTSLYALLALSLSSASLGWQHLAYAACQSSTAQGSTTQSPTPASKAVADVLANAVERGDTPGVVALVVDRKGCVFEGSAGKLDIARDAPLSSNAIFRIASMTKPVTSAAIMILVEQGKLSLDDPVSKYLPAIGQLQVLTHFNEVDGTYETRPAKRPMTIRHLLAQTSGMGYAFSNPTVAALVKLTHKAEWELPLQHDPGETWMYSPSPAVLGLVVEKISGISLEEFLQRHIFVPLGMHDTSFAVPLDQQSRVITIYQHVDGKFQDLPQPSINAVPTPPFRGDGGLLSTADDYGRFVSMLLGGGQLGHVRILSARSVRLMGENQIGAIVVSQQPAADPVRTRPFPLGAGRDKFGLGFQITEASGAGANSRSQGSLSWAGIYNTEFWIDPQRGIAGVLLMQFLPFYDEGAIRTLKDFENAVYEDLNHGP
jgi:methyl acetate hydrolase